MYEYGFLCLTSLFEKALRVGYPTINYLALSPTSGRNLIWVYTYMFLSYPLIHQDINWPKFWSSVMWVGQKIHMRHLFHTYIRLPTYINMTFLTKLCQYLNIESSQQWTVCSPNIFKYIQARLITHMTNLSTENKENHKTISKDSKIHYRWHILVQLVNMNN